MKANRKFINGEEAVSAVIGVILMVAITVAIAATVYVYVSGMVTPTETGKVISAIQTNLNTTDNNVMYKVSNADSGSPWNSVIVQYSGGTIAANKVHYGNWSALSGNIKVGDYFVIELPADGTYVLDMIYGGRIIWTSPSITV